VLLAIACATASHAADGTFTFQLAQEPGNPASCMRLDSAFDRPFTLSATGTTAILRGAGGIHINMTSAAPDRYQGVLELSGEGLTFVADVGAARTLSARGDNLGCKWSGKAS
jgi:hypothetical protein